MTSRGGVINEDHACRRLRWGGFAPGHPGPLVAHHAFAAEFGAGKPVQPEFDEMEIRRLT